MARLCFRTYGDKKGGAERHPLTCQNAEGSLNNTPAILLIRLTCISVAVIKSFIFPLRVVCDAHFMDLIQQILRQMLVGFNEQRRHKTQIIVYLRRVSEAF